jgi:hypothetical protein
MGQTGHICFYSTREATDCVRLISDAVGVSGCSRIFAARTVGTDDGWRLFNRNSRKLRSGRPILTLDEIELKTFRQPLAPADAASLYKPRRRLMLDLLSSPIAEAGGAGAERDIPPEVRTGFRFSELILNVGWHDIFECAENDEGHLFARAFFSVSLHGHGSPSDWPEYRRLVLQVPEVVAVRKAFESVAGPLESCVYWNV